MCYLLQFNYTIKQADAQYLSVKNIRFFSSLDCLNATAPSFSRCECLKMRGHPFCSLSISGRGCFVPDGAALLIRRAFPLTIKRAVSHTRQLSLLVLFIGLLVIFIGLLVLFLGIISAVFVDYWYCFTVYSCFEWDLSLFSRETIVGTHELPYGSVTAH